MVADKYEFVLFISGMSVKSVHAIENLEAICKEYFNTNFDIKIIDINKEPEAAEQYQIFAIPTLIKKQPLPVRTILGDLSDKQKILRILDII